MRQLLAEHCNLSDRLIHGFVIDFLDVYIGDWHWPPLILLIWGFVLVQGLSLLSFFPDKMSVLKMQKKAKVIRQEVNKITPALWRGYANRRY